MLAPTVAPPSPSPAAADVIVRADGIAKRWGATTALDGASFTVGPGVTGLLGSNGAGKTTIFGMILGLHHPTEGTLSVLGLDPTSMGHEVRARVGYSPELHTLPEDMRAHDLVRHIAEVHGIPHREATARASDVLWQVGLGEERFRPVGTMSTGQRQRVKLAQAIAHDPALVLLDEPTDGLDPVQRDDMLALIRRVGTEFGINVLLSSHLLEEVERVCDATVILGGKRVVASGQIDDLKRHTEGMLIELVDGLDAVTVELRAAGAMVELTGPERLLVQWPDHDPDALYDLVRDALTATGAGVRRLAPRRVSLEDVFLELGT
jgi:ABC-2 type transport system ATP-binding protein